MTTGCARLYGRRMTDTIALITPRRTRMGAARLAGSAWVAGGALWLAAGLVHDEAGSRFAAASTLWLAADVLIAAAIAALLVLRPHGASRAGAVALALALAARLSFGAGEIVSIVQGHDDNLLLPVGALLTALALTGYGAVLMRRRETPARVTWAFLAMGLYPFLVMFPVVAATGEPSMLLIGLWGVPAAIIGIALTPHRPRERAQLGAD